MSSARTADLWWKNAIVYCLDAETFYDSDGDGTGDLVGLTEKIDHLAGLGVTCLWLMPFFPTPGRDDGYDITDYYGVDERLGSLGDFVALVRTAKDRGMRVIIDLVINHTSDQHPWFKSARRSPNSRFRDYYVWQDEPQDDPDTGVVFPDAEDSIWSYDDQAEQYYLHHFYSHQPDLNIGNPVVREEMAKIAGFWLELGVDGFRVDAVPYLLETGGIDGDLRLDPHSYLKDLRAFMARRRGDAALLGEVNLPNDELVAYFGDEQADEIQMLFAFPLMQQIYLAFARQDARPLAEALRDLPAVSDASQWAMFLRNHDELTLDKLSDDEREEVFAAFGPDEDMQLFGRGLRRRLPPMLDGDQRRLRLAYSLMFSLPGTPVLFYGEEIGMGENLDIDGRLSVRTPMQWSDDKNGGFSDVAPSRLRRPVTEGRFGPLAVNVADQERDPDSLLNWMQRLIRKRRETPEFGWGAWDVLDAGDDAVLAHRCAWEGGTVLALHNLADAPREITLRIPQIDDGHLVDLLETRSTTHRLDGGRVDLKLEGFGHRWLRLRGSV
ncbi:MAG: alpha-amylase family protein [Actinobacteria bacterium]|jgi:maltose alpha-D-glucosyltransferase/alpha-amylase|nr:alpha-amylase family protein [Actinomycetota bacterium]